jgi:hypothetical protein
MRGPSGALVQVTEHLSGLPEPTACGGDLRGISTMLVVAVLWSFRGATAVCATVHSTPPPAQRPAPTCMARRTGSCSFSHALSLLGLRRDDPQFFLCQRPVNRALGFCHSLGFAGSSAPYGNACVERDRPFPHVPSNALNDAILNAAMLHVVKNRSPQRRLAMTNSLRVSVGADGAILGICASGGPGSRDFPHTPASLRIRFPRRPE